MDEGAEGQRITTIRNNSISSLIQGVVTFVSWSLFLNRLETNPGVSGAEWMAVAFQSLSALLVSFKTTLPLWQMGAVTAIGILGACCAVLRASPLGDAFLIGLSSTAAILIFTATKVCVGVPAALVLGKLGKVVRRAKERWP